jgi:hypothetical protein
MAGRTLADVEADYTAVHTAWRESLNAERVGSGDKQIQRARTEELYKQMMVLDAEVKSLTRGGFRIRGGTPT